MLGTCLRISPYRSALGVLVALAGLLVLLAAYAVPAATSTPTDRPAPGPSSTFAQQWAELVAAAKQKGNIVVAPPPNWGEVVGHRQILVAFQVKFGIKVTSGRGTGRSQAQRLLAERRAGLYSGDIVVGGAGTFTRVLLPAGAFEPIKPLLFHPEVVDQSLWKGGIHRYLDKEQQYVFLYAGRNAPIGISINTQLVQPGEIKSFWDLLKPKWRGKIVAHHPRLSTQGVTYSQVYWDKDLGPEFLRRIFSEAKLNYVTTRREFADGIAFGAYAIGFLEGGGQRTIRRMEREGLPVKMLMAQDLKVDVARVSPGGASMFAAVNRPPNPNAQKLFVNWLLTRETQLLFNRFGNGEYESLRADVPNDEVLPRYRIPENFYLREADRDFAEKERIAEGFVLQLIDKLGL